MAESLTLYNRSVKDLLYDYGLTSIYHNIWAYNPSLALLKEPDIYEIVMNDAVVASAIDRHIRNVVRTSRILPAKGSKRKENKRAAAIFQNMMDRAPMLGAARRRSAWAVAYGRSFEFMACAPWHGRLGGDEEKPTTWQIPVGFENVDPRRMRWQVERSQGPNPRIKTHLAMWSVAGSRWITIPDEGQRYFVRWTWPMREDRVGYGRGLLDSTFHYHWLKTESLRKLAESNDRFANGWVVAKIDRTAAGSTTKTSDDLVSEMKTALRKTRGEHIVVIDKADDIEILEPSGRGAESILKSVRYYDECIERLWNGSTGPAGHGEEGGHGSMAKVKVADDEQEAFYQAEREELDEVWTRDCLGLLWELNQSALAEMGLADADMPRFDSEQIKREAPLDALQVASGLSLLGAPVVREELYAKVGWTPPDEDDEVVLGAPPGMEFGLDKETGRPQPKETIEGDMEREKQKQSGKDRAS